MKKLLSIIVLGLLFSGNSSFAKTKLNCKYFDSWRMVHTETTSTTTSPVSNVLDYITIVLDMENKKIIQTHSPGVYSFSGSKQKWSEDHISWLKRIKLEDEKKLIDIAGSLDRYSLTYSYTEDISGYSGKPYDKQNPLKIIQLENVWIAWRCEIKKKKL